MSQEKENGKRERDEAEAAHHEPDEEGPPLKAQKHTDEEEPSSVKIEMDSTATEQSAREDSTALPGDSTTKVENDRPTAADSSGADGAAEEEVAFVVDRTGKEVKVKEEDDEIPQESGEGGSATVPSDTVSSVAEASDAAAAASSSSSAPSTAGVVADSSPSKTAARSTSSPAAALAPAPGSTDAPTQTSLALAGGSTPATPATTTTAAPTTTAAAAVHPTTTPGHNGADPRLAPPAALAPSAAVGVDPAAPAMVVNLDQIVEERGEIPALYVGKVIGKGGEMIRDLQARSGARIDVDQNVPPGLPRGITYRGTRRTVDFAKRLVSLLQQDNVSENDLPLGEAKRRYVIIPAMAVGKVIGRGGEMIRELQNKSQAKIQIDHSGASGMPTDQKQVSITGTEQAVIKAEEMINFLVANPLIEGLQAIAMLVDEKLRGGQWGSGPPYLGLPNHGINMQPEVTGMGGGGGGGGGHGGPYGGGGGGGYGAPAMPPVVYPPVQAYGGHAMAGPAYAAPPPTAAPYGGQEVDVVYAQKQFMGRIIGKKGITINDLQRRSSCDIQVNQDVPQGQDCEITIRGTRQGIEMVKQMIREIIEVGPHHPYAGGADSAAMGMGYHPQQGYGQAYGGGAPAASYGAAAYAYPVAQTYAQTSYQQQQPSYQPHQAAAYAAAQPQTHYGMPAQQQPLQPSYGQAQPAALPQYGGYGPAAVISPVVSEWKTATSPDGQVYYYNERTGVTQWEKPAGMP